MIYYKILGQILIFVICFIAPAFGFKAEITGECVRVIDGDTIVLATSQDALIKIRLYGVDTPELKQKYGPEAKQFLIDKIYKKTITLKDTGEQSHGRVVGVIFIDGTCLNAELLKKGFAWFSSKYCKKFFCYSWQSFESDSKRNSLGLWADPDPVSPWSFRYAQRRNQ